MKCTLCTTTAKHFFTDEKTGGDYFLCPNCDLRFLDPAKYLNRTDELQRYEMHENDPGDISYQNYLKPIFEWLIARLTHQLSTRLANHSHGQKLSTHASPIPQGLDYGCGKGPLLAQMLEKQGFKVELYDPYYYPDKSYAKKFYDFIVAVETAEHFYSPAKEFAHLKGLLKPGGGLAIVTALYSEKIDFKSWHYRRDPTHVCFFSARTFEWIRKNFGFATYDLTESRMNWLS